jgi:hypothetical protein
LYEILVFGILVSVQVYLEYSENLYTKFVGNSFISP